MLILLVGHQPMDLCTNNACLKHGLYLLRIAFRLTLIWVGFLGVRFAAGEGWVKLTLVYNLLELCQKLENWCVRTHT